MAASVESAEPPPPTVSGIIVLDFDDPAVIGRRHSVRPLKTSAPHPLQGPVTLTPRNVIADDGGREATVDPPRRAPAACCQILTTSKGVTARAVTSFSSRQGCCCLGSRGYCCSPTAPGAGGGDRDLLDCGAEPTSCGEDIRGGGGGGGAFAEGAAAIQRRRPDCAVDHAAAAAAAGGRRADAGRAAAVAASAGGRP
mmetsp:Transcript_32447/g.78538  ORF Transcript_32447/g.78538 Transcript_32447/m.78538 type:complete len:197 (-) Transcript_32447:1384-1974(-)